jgi:hypothetical protein
VLFSKSINRSTCVDAPPFNGRGFFLVPLFSPVWQLYPQQSSAIGAVVVFAFRYTFRHIILYAQPLYPGQQHKAKDRVTMDLILQAWGGGLYLLNKAFFALAEGKDKARKRRFRILGWTVYILGVPAWIIILIGKHDWIAASIEAGGIPAMIFGLCNAYRDTHIPNKKLDLVAACFTYAALLFGVGYSLYDYGGITSATQLLEIGVMIGFLVGSYLLAKKNVSGWLFFMLMNVSMATLMLLQNKPLLSIQQLLSLCFVIYGFTMARRTTTQAA